MAAIPTLILSKNRASQLRLLLESLYFNATGIFDPYVLWTANTSSFEAGYKKLISEFNNVRFARESYMLHNIYNFLDFWKNEHFALFMDDCIFYKPLRLSPEEIKANIDDDTWCLSLRLGLNTTKDAKKDLEPVHQDDNFIKYKFKEHDPYDSYGFCFSWDGVVYKTQDVLDLFNRDDFTNTNNQWAILPQKIENFTSNNRDKIPKNMMSCLNHSCVVSMNYNSTHPAANFNGYPLDELNSHYLNGNIIDIKTFNFNDITSTHESRPFALRQF